MWRKFLRHSININYIIFDLYRIAGYANTTFNIIIRFINRVNDDRVIFRII